MMPINIRLYFGGHFVTQKNKTTYEKKPNVAPKDFGLTLRLNVEEMCYFEVVYWIKSDLGYNDVGEIWFRKHGCSLHNGRKRLMSDKDLPEFFQAPEKDGFYHLYLVQPEEERGINRLVYGPGVTFYDDNDNTESFSGRGESERSESRRGESERGEGSDLVISVENNLGGPQDRIGENIVLENPRSEINTNHISQNTFPNTEPSVAALAKTTSSHKLPVISSKKRNCTEEISTGVIENTEAAWNEVLVEGAGEGEVNGEPHLDDCDVLLSDDDYEDQNGEDLFKDFVVEDISETVKNSFSQFGAVESERENENEDREDNGEALNVPDEEDLNDSDDEVVSVLGSDDEGVHYPEFNPATDFKGEIVFSKGLRFADNNLFRKALLWQAIQRGFNYTFLHNNSNRVSVYCAKRCGCPVKRGRLAKCTCKEKRKCRFKIHYKKLKKEDTWQIISYRPEHICGHQTHNPKLNSQYLAERYIEDFRENPKWKVDDFLQRAKRECGCKIGFYMAYYAKVRAIKMIFGDASKEYERVWDYAVTIGKYNPGSTAVVKVTGVEEEQPQFQRFYVCLQACKQGFIAGCRPILGVDGAHLKGPYPGILLIAVGKDGNNNLFPVAWAVVETENSDTWAWFLELVRNDIASVADSVTWLHERDELTYMSDRQKGLLDAFSKVMPGAETRYCCRHIWSNFRLKFPGIVFREHFWKAARSTIKEHFNIHMERIKNINIEAYNYLQAIPVEHWSRHGFSTASKSGMLLNNVCESFNNVLREARTKPLLQLLEWIRRYVMARCLAKRQGLTKFEGVIMPSVVKMIEKGLKLTSSMRLRQASLFEFEVDHDDFTYIVDLESHSCNCGRWTLLGIPCWHALACIQLRRLNYEDFVHKAYHVETYAATYSPRLRAMPGHQQWEQTAYPKPLPPPHKTLPGRPSNKKRKKGEGEDQETQEVKKAKRQNRCLKCGELGHYQKKCKTKEASTTNVSKGVVPSNTKAPNQKGKDKVAALTKPTAKKVSSSSKSPKGSNATKNKAKSTPYQDVQASQMSTSSSAPQLNPQSQP